MNSIPLSVMTRILKSKDMICNLVYLIENAPWLDRSSKSFQRFEGGNWANIKQDDLLVLGKVEGQVNFYLVIILNCYRYG